MRSRIRVSMIAQIVDSDGTPVNGYGEPYGRGWKRTWEWVKRDVSRAKFCPKSLHGDSRRHVFYENVPTDPQLILCSCHNKWRLVDGLAVGSTGRSYKRHAAQSRETGE